MSTLLRILFAFVLACLAAGVVQVMFVKTPAELLSLSLAERVTFMETAGRLVLVAATQSANFAAPFALVAIVFSFLLETRNTLFYTLTGLAIAMLALTALYRIEPENAVTILNWRAGLAFGLSGLVGGYVFGLLTGKSKTTENDRFDVDKNERPDQQRPTNQNSDKQKLDKPQRASRERLKEHLQKHKENSPPPIPASNGEHAKR